jgi:hypothetical protein
MEKLQLRPTFPDKPLIKTYVALCESCRSIAPLQLLFLEIFKLVVTFLSFAFAKMLKWNKRRAADAVAAPRASCARYGRAGHVASARPSSVRKPRHLRGGPRTVVGFPPRLSPSTPRLGRGRPGPGPRARARTRTRQPARMQAPYSRHLLDPSLSFANRAEQAGSPVARRHLAQAATEQSAAAVLHGHYRHLASPHLIPVAQPLLSLP